MANNVRNEMPTQPPKERVCNFKEVTLGYSDTLAVEEAQRCLNCKNAPCMQGCPVGVKIPLFISRIKDGDVEGAISVIKLDNNLPAVCGRVCPQENQCEKYCVRKNKLGGSVAIGNLERYCADYAFNTQKTAQECHSAIDKRVAVVGSGPASLSCSGDLARAGVKVTMFEALHEAGGVLVYGIPEFRLPKSLVKKEIDEVLALGVKLEKNVVVGKSITIDELLEEYDAVFIGSGAGVPMFLRIKGENFNGVYSANEYLTRVNLMRAYGEESITPVRRGKRVVVVGAGNVAMDASRTALRLGANVKLVYRRSRAEMPARSEEIQHAEDEGVEFNLLVNPIEILGDEDGNVKAIKCVKMMLMEPDESGRRRPKAIEGSEFIIGCDEVIVALGTTPNPIIKQSMPSLKVSDKGTIITDEDGRTNIDRLYAGGDATTGSATVILAMGAGKRSARAILEQFEKDN